MTDEEFEKYWHPKFLSRNWELYSEETKSVIYLYMWEVASTLSGDNYSIASELNRTFCIALKETSAK